MQTLQLGFCSYRRFDRLDSRNGLISKAAVINLNANAVRERLSGFCRAKSHDKAALVPATASARIKLIIDRPIMPIGSTEGRITRRAGVEAKMLTAQITQYAKGATPMLISTLAIKNLVRSDILNPQ